MKITIMILTIFSLLGVADPVMADSNYLETTYADEGASKDAIIQNEINLKEKELSNPTINENLSIGNKLFLEEESAQPYAITSRNKKLAVTRVEQLNSYYCGPAAVKMVLDYLGVSKTQAQIASAIGTTSASGSAAANMATYMKNMTGFNYVRQSTATRPLSSVTTTLDANKPVIFNVKTQVLNTSYPFNEGHFVTGYGYTMVTDTGLDPKFINEEIFEEAKSDDSAQVLSVSYVSQFFYYDPWYATYTRGEKTATYDRMLNATNANHGAFIW